MARILKVHYEDRDRITDNFGVPDNYTLPVLLDHMEWLILPRRDGEQAQQIAVRLRDVAWMSVVDE